MRDVYIAGVGMTRFGRHGERGIKSLVAEAVGLAQADAGFADTRYERPMIFYSNVFGGTLQGQESVRGQQALRETTLIGGTVINVENACASGSTAFNLAWLTIASGRAETAIVVGAEKLDVPDKRLAFDALHGALDQDLMDEIKAEYSDEDSQSVFMAIYARYAREFMEASGATQEDFARVCVKNQAAGLLNDKAQYGGKLTIEEVIGARHIAGPITLPMCAPMSDGAAAVILSTADGLRPGNEPRVRVLASEVQAGLAGGNRELVPRTARRAFESAGIGPRDIDVIECHDAAAPGEMIALDDVSLGELGDTVELMRSGDTALGGTLPVNPSGGLECRGHPFGATGLAQIIEVSDQLKGRCGARQVEGARIGLTENAGGYIGPDAAAATITILGRD